jgi:hypothetical protein
MENKYYTPEISEFSPGFEYEYLGHFGTDFGKWITDLCSINLKLIHDLLVMNNIRIKYLDKEDIESLGFIFSDRDSKYGNEDRFIFNQICININKNNYTNIKVCKMVDNPYENHGNHYVLFNGTIKNKSELVKILKMVKV